MGAHEPTGLPFAALALTMGDPAGIGPDITLKAWRERREHDLAPFVVFGCPDTFAARAATLGVEAPIETVADFAHAISVFETRLPVWPIPCAAPVVAGEPDSRNAPATISAIELAVLAVKRGEARAVVTNAGVSRVFVVAEGRVEERVVTLASRDEETVTLASGVSAGEQVAVDRLDTLFDGARVGARSPAAGIQVE